jgi:hypothetical protein
VKKYFLVFIFIFPVICGCQSDKTKNQDTTDTYITALEDSLRDHNSPSLLSVEQWKNDYGPGLILTTAHYEIFTTLLQTSILRKIPQFMESAYQAYNSQLPKPVETMTKFPVYLFAQRRQWEDFTKDFTGDNAEIFFKIQAGAYYHNGACVAYDIGPERTFFALGHEGWHQFNVRFFKYRLPSWLDEGVAMLFEANRTQKGQIFFDPSLNKYRLEALQKTIAGGNLMSLQELTAINPGQVLSSEQTDSAMAFYSQSYALVRFLREADSGKRLNVFRKMLADGLQGKWPIDDISRDVAIDRNQPRTILWNHIVGTRLFQEYISYDFEQIEVEYLAFIKSLI